MEIKYYDGAYDSIELLKSFGESINFTYDVIMKDGSTFQTGMVVGCGLLVLMDIEEIIALANETIETIILEDVLEKDVKKVIFLHVKTF